MKNKTLRTIRDFINFIASILFGILALFVLLFFNVFYAFGEWFISNKTYKQCFKKGYKKIQEELYEE